MEIKFLFSLMKICFNLESQNTEVFSPKMGKMLIQIPAPGGRAAVCSRMCAHIRQYDGHGVDVIIRMVRFLVVVVVALKP